MKKSREIRIAPAIKKELASEFKVSYQTIDMTMKYIFNSETSKKIRKRAKEKLLEEANNIED
ncbi:hypothetical protein [Bergeyella zoohelcum]|uniref:Uncharacterized protein n=1 Tax=Bergeyella zoohelcum TaxID=1015 RepID=A0A376BYB3_9FLAO|nr:hypothetical protein [Bergeyella zoohelcum]EKB61437.1 hypothetical protein HMPREF9700_00932 [Bergeyella zoohelcum CCUG 30536]SSZ46471.1 Uncharacterised protein [Bergeyella zoohelcum]